MNTVLRRLLVVSCGALAACGSDGGTDLTLVAVNGAALDYFAGTGVTGATVAVDGSPTLTATSGAAGAYSLPNVPATQSLVLLTSKSGYRPTRNFEVDASANVTADVALVSVADAQRQYTAVGLASSAGLAVVFIELVDGTGAPRTGIAAAGIGLVDGTMSPVGVGPYFFGAAGDIVSNVDLSVSTAFGGRARAAFLNVPQGSHTLRVAVNAQTIVAPVVVVSGGATLVER
jgi:hypothetical protein